MRLNLPFDKHSERELRGVEVNVLCSQAVLPWAFNSTPISVRN